MAKQLPERPNLEQLKRQAKDLLHALRAGDTAARARFAILPKNVAAPALHDAQSVVAREYGFASWNLLRQHVEEQTLGFEAALAEFLLAASDGRNDRAERLLALHPRIARSGLTAALLLGEAEGVAAALAQALAPPARRSPRAFGSHCIMSVTVRLAPARPRVKPDWPPAPVCCWRRAPMPTCASPGSIMRSSGRYCGVRCAWCVRRHWRGCCWKQAPTRAMV